MVKWRKLQKILVGARERGRHTSRCNDMGKTQGHVTEAKAETEAGADACITLIDARSAFGEVNDNSFQSVLRCHNIPDEGGA